MRVIGLAGLYQVQTINHHVAARQGLAAQYQSSCGTLEFGTVGALWYYGYLHFAKPEDALLLSDFTMLKTIPGEDYKVSLPPAT